MHTWTRHKRFFPFLGAIATGFLLASAFPPLAWRDAAWFALIPLVLALQGRSNRDAFRLGLLGGIVFWLLSIQWLTHVSVVGWFTLSLYCALFVTPFAVILAWWFRTVGKGRWWTNLLCMAVAATVWTGFEYLRSVLFTGFPWNPLGVSQYRNVAIIQIAAWGGVYAVSWLIVFLNAGISLTIVQYVQRSAKGLGRPHAELIAGFLLLALSFAHGWRTLSQGSRDNPGVDLHVALVQPNIPQSLKWDAEMVELIYERLHDWSHAAVRVPGLDLLVWPETAVPDDVRTSIPSYELVYNVATQGVPILVGSMDTEWKDDFTPVYYNSSFLFDETGAIVKGYDKRHLVIFGEYVPLQRVFPFMSAMTPIEESFTPGTTSTVFRLGSPPVSFSALICFEDTVPALARESVRNGARLLINQTNDAWFDPSQASLQHMAHCVFRCVENRVPALRAANTGVSCAMDRYGRVYDVLSDEGGTVRVAGFRATRVRVPPADMPTTFYTRHGDLFARACALIAVTMLAGILLRRYFALGGSRTGNPP